jgi:hypothetical protein
VTSCSWSMSVTGVSRPELESQVASLLAAASVPIVRERKGREEHDDLRPSVLALALSEEPDAMVVGTGPDDPAPVGMVAELATQPRGVRPVELMRGLIAVSGPSGDHRPVTGTTGPTTAGTPVLGRARRTHQWIERDGFREEPLGLRGDALGVDRAAHALERAS